MPIKNTGDEYGSIAKWLHWITATLFLASYFAIYYRHWFAESELENWIAIQLHLSIGITVGLITLLRIIWRFLNQVPESEPGNRFQHFASRVGHYALYAIMIIMPISGYLSISRVNITYILLFDIGSLSDIQIFSRLGSMLMTLEEPAAIIHSYLGAWIVWILILGHIFAALYHHFIKVDRTLYKMLFHKL